MRAGLGGVSIDGEIGIPFVTDRLRALGILHVDPPARGAVLVVDSYDPTERARQAQRDDVCLRVFVDDAGGPVLPGYDVVWNPNACGKASLYPAFKGPVLTGPHAVPLEDHDTSWQGRGSSRVAVVLGGGAATGAVVQAVRDLSRVAPQLQFAGAGPWVPPEWEQIDQTDPWPAIASCSCLVTASGRTVWEAAAVGIPVVALVVAENQRPIGAWVREAGAPCLQAAGRGDGPTLTREIRDAIPLARSLPRLRDGSGRVAARLARLALARRAA